MAFKTEYQIILMCLDYEENDYNTGEILED